MRLQPSWSQVLLYFQHAETRGAESITQIFSGVYQRQSAVACVETFHLDLVGKSTGKPHGSAG